MIIEHMGQQPVVVMIQGNACGAKGHSQLMHRTNTYLGKIPKGVICCEKKV